MANQILDIVTQIKNVLNTSDFQTFINNMTQIKQWDITKQYTQEDLVLYNDLFYRCNVINSTIGTFINSEWKLLNDNSITYDEFNI